MFGAPQEVLLLHGKARCIWFLHLFGAHLRNFMKVCNGIGSCGHSPCSHEKQFKLFCQDESGELTLLAEGYYADEEAATSDLLDQWDPRLDSASCSPIIKATE
jgi:hypothetical protein